MIIDLRQSVIEEATTPTAKHLHPVLPIIIFTFERLLLGLQTFRRENCNAPRCAQKQSSFTTKGRYSLCSSFCKRESHQRCELANAAFHSRACQRGTNRSRSVTISFHARARELRGVSQVVQLCKDPSAPKFDIHLLAKTC